jgi:putative two-component system response regulator
VSHTVDIFQGRILIVDDQAPNLCLLDQMLRGAGYLHVTTTSDPEAVSDLQATNQFDLILLDLKMPVMDGFQVMEALRALEPDGCLPVLVITAQPDLKLRALKAGAMDFISKPFELAELLVRVRNLLEVRLLNKRLNQYNLELETRVRERTADLKQSYLETIFTMTRAAEHKDEGTGTHVKRISHYSRELARILGQDETFVDLIFFASPMHDIGKIGIPDQVLLKPGAFTAEERVVMKNHAVMGAAILGQSDSPHLKLADEIALNHHESWDGKGYPDGKQGETIPIAARIMGICDVYDALRSARPYKPAFGHRKSMDILVHGDERTQASQFDPAILEAFRHNHEKFSKIYREHTI